MNSDSTTDLKELVCLLLEEVEALSESVYEDELETLFGKEKQQRKQELIRSVFPS